MVINYTNINKTNNHITPQRFQQHLNVEYFSRLIRYYRFCGSLQDFLDIGLLVTYDQWYVVLVLSNSRSLPHSWLISGFVTEMSRCMPQVEQELFSLPEHLGSFTMSSGGGVRVAQYLFLCVVFYRSLFVLLSFIDSLFWLPSWYLQTLLTEYKKWQDPCLGQTQKCDKVKPVNLILCILAKRIRA